MIIKMKFMGPIILVENLERSKAYKNSQICVLSIFLASIYSENLRFANTWVCLFPLFIMMY